jgi:hypothetical protein
MHDHTSAVNARVDSPMYDLMQAEFGPSLADMTFNCAPRHLALLLAAVLAPAGCGSKQQTPVSGPANIEGGIKVDPTRCDSRGKQVVTADTNDDKKPDVTKLYDVRDNAGGKVQVLACKQVDLNYDNKIDIVYHYDQAGTLSFEEFDLDFDGRYDLWAYYQGGQKVREEMDTNYDRRPDFTKFFEGSRMVRIERDANNDGRVDQWEYYENGKLDRIGYDTSGSGRADRWDRAPESVEQGAPAAAEAPAATPSASGTTAPPAPPPAPPAPATARP